jgi:hypothetical protein
LCRDAPALIVIRQRRLAGDQLSIREKLNRNRPVVIGIASVLILGAFVYIIQQLMGGERPRVPNEAYYTTDDGATYFEDDVNRIPPFDHDGKQAVKAQVYTCGGTNFVGYLIRYTPEAQKQLAAANGVGVGAIRAVGTEINKPLTGDAGWTNSNDKGAGRIYAIKCPDGSDNAPSVVLP